MRKDNGAVTKAKPTSAPIQIPSAGISIAARTRSRRPEALLLILPAPFPRRTPLDPLAFITDLARDAGALLRERIDDPREIAQKRPHDLVTDADRASENLILARIRAAFPGAAILGEESGSHAGTGEERFIVDPLDGTTNYAHRYPLFCVSIGYERAGVLEAGAIYAPLLDELYAARRGGGATCNERPIRASATARVTDAMVCTGFNPAGYARNARQFATLSEHAQAVRRDGSAALDLAFVAAGRFDAFWEWDLKPWDVAAGSVIVTEAGGRVGAITGGALDIVDGSILAANTGVYEEMERLLTGAER
ncbi:MAG TPA: inositol monophosphatase family protein [Candidatus Acidoferrum sp.]|nr:inositol monophosphatase family protein [Candidatus Acidoferrum sp.]